MNLRKRIFCMRRRTFTFLLAALATGCLRGNRDGDGSSNLSQNNQNRTRADLSIEDVSALGDPPYSTVELEDVPMTLSSVHYFDAHAYEGVVAASAVVEPSTDASPPVLRTVAFHNGDQTTELPLEFTPPHDCVGGSAEGNFLYAVPTETHDLTDGGHDLSREMDGTWYLAEESEPDDWLPETVELEPGEGYAGEYALVTEDGELHEDVYWFDGVEERTGLSVTAWSTETPGPMEASRFEGREVPDLEVAGSEFDTLWYHVADENTKMYLEPSDELVEPPATVTFRLVNRSDQPVRNRGIGWRLYKLVEGDFLEVAFTRVRGQGSRRIPPGRYHTSEVRLSHRSVDEGRDGVSVGHLGGGVYAYTDGFGFEDALPASLIEVDAPSLGESDVEPPEDTTVKRDGGTVVVTTDAWRESDDKREKIVVTRADGSDDPESLIPEQLYNAEEGLRYALPFFDEGVEAVEVRADWHLVNRTVGEDEDRTVRYSDEPYTVRRRRT